MKDEYPLYPELPEAGKDEAQALVDAFKGKLKAAADEAIGDLYCDVATFIENDSWGNFRNKIMDGFTNYGNRKLQADYDFNRIRQAIFKEYREEIIEDLNQDMVEEIEGLKKSLEFERQLKRDR